MPELVVVALSSCAGAYLLLGLSSSRRFSVGAASGRAVGSSSWKKPCLPFGKSTSGEADVPSMLDIVTLGLTAGLSFDASLELYCERYEGNLALAIKRALLAWRMGILNRSEGLRQVASDAEAPSLIDVADVVDEALELGLPLADTLTRQADALRLARRSQVEERIERVPVKMLIPLGTLIVPAMLLAILGSLLGFVVELG